MYRGIDCSLDVETLSRKPGGVIASIGATIFDPFDTSPDSAALRDGGHDFYAVLSFNDQYIKMLTVDASTTKWWQKEKYWPALSQEMMNSSITLKEALDQFVEFLRRHRPEMLWANSPNFDTSFMQAAMQRVQGEWPLSYRQDADFRILMNLAYPMREMRPERPKELSHYYDHHALGDAKLQAYQLSKAFVELGLTRKRYENVLAAHPELLESERRYAEATNGPYGQPADLEVAMAAKPEAKAKKKKAGPGVS